MFWLKNWKKLKKFRKFYWVLKVFKKNLEVLENFNKMYTIMYAFHCFVKEKHCTLIVYITEFFLKSGGAKCITAPPPRVKSGGPCPHPLWRTPWGGAKAGKLNGGGAMTNESYIIMGFCQSILMNLSFHKKLGGGPS